MSGGERQARTYRVLIVVLSAIFVSLCTVVGEALTPNTWPPQNLFASIVAIFLIALPFAAGVIIPVFFQAIPSSSEPKSLRRLVKKTWKEQTFSATTVAILLAVVALVVWFLTPVTALSQLVKDDRLGGLDLARYCKSRGYTKNTDEACSWEIPLDEACEWRYGRVGLHPEGGRYSMECFTPEGESLGGIWGMSDYCLARFQPSINVRATPNEKGWECRAEIDKDLACGWFYAKGGLEARKDGTNWECYQ